MFESVGHNSSSLNYLQIRPSGPLTPDTKYVNICEMPGMTDNTTLREYVITVRNKNDLPDLYNELESIGSGRNEVFPNRVVDCVHRREVSRNTHYYLTDAEAQLIAQDPRILAVELSIAEAGLEVRSSAGYWANINASKNTNTLLPTDKNWGLLRVYEELTRYGWTANGAINPTQNGNIRLDNDGENVDVVIADGHIDPAHPEFALNSDGTGGTRVIQKDWFADLNSAVFPANPQSNYQYNLSSSSNHGHHVAGIAAGNSQGWARKANIYNFDPLSTNASFTSPNIPYLYVFDYIREWHRTKPVNPATGVKNPTVVNASFSVSLRGAPTSIINSVTYRGTTYSGPFSAARLLNDFGIYSSSGVLGGDNGVSLRNTAMDADVEDALAEGVIVVSAAGNSSFKVDIPGNPDYDNYATVSTSPYAGNYYYHRGTSPSAVHGVINVGSIGQGNSLVFTNSLDGKADYSNCGPRIDIYAPGSRITSAWNSSSSAPGLPNPVPDPRNTAYYFAKDDGTSMASPQVAGVVALWVQNHPTWTATDILSNFSELYTSNKIYDPGDSYSNFNSLQGSPNRFLKIPAEVRIAPLTLVSSSTVSLLIGAPVSFVPITVSGGKIPYFYSLFPPTLPVGLEFNTSTGVISGTPTVLTSATHYVVNVTDSSFQETADSFDLTVTPTPLYSTLLITSKQVAINKNAVAFKPVDYSGGFGTKTYSITPVIPGMSIDPNTGYISGKPTVLTPGTAVTVRVTDSLGQVSSKSFTLIVDSRYPIYPVSTGSLIEIIDFNTITNVIESIAGHNSLGYGVNDLQSEAVTTGSIITSLQWNNVVEDLNRISRHQTGTSIIQQAGIIASPGGVTWVIDTTNSTNYISSTTNIYSTNKLLVSPSRVTWSVPTSGASTIVSASGWYIGSHVGGQGSTGTVFPTFDFKGKIKADNSNRIWDISQELLANRFTVADSQLAPLSTTDSISTRVSTWDEAINHIVKANWPTDEQADYFFNLGGYIELDASQSGTASTAADTAWVEVIGSLAPIYYTRQDWVNWTSTSTEVIGTPPNDFVKYSVVAEKTAGNEVTFNISFLNTTTSFLAYNRNPVWVLGLGSGASIYTYPTSRTWTVGTGASISVSPSSKTWNLVTP